MKKAQAKVRAELATTPKFDAKAAQALVTQIDEHIRAISATPNDRYDDKGEKLGQQGPLAILAKRIFVELDPTLLASVGKNEKIVISSRPNRLQYPLPQQSAGAVTQFEGEFAVWQEAVGSRTFTFPQNRGLSTSLYYLLQKNFDWNHGTNDEPQSLSKLLVFLSSFNESGTSTIEVRLVDQKGVYAASSQLGINAMLSVGQRNDPFGDIRKNLDPNEPDVKLTELSFEYVNRMKEVFGGSGDPEKSPPISVELEKRMLAPEKFDPLSFLLPETLFQSADYSKRSVVACPPDLASLMFDAVAAQGVLKPSKFVEMIRSPEMGMKVIEEPGWMVICSSVSGTQMGESFSHRTERPLIGRVMRSIKENDLVTIELSAEIAYKTGSDDEEGVVPLMFFVGTYRPELARNIEIGRGNMWSWLYGSLDVTQRRMLFDGKELLLKDLRPEQRQKIEKFVKSARSELNFSPLPSPNGLTQDSYGTFYGGIKSEPTERWPNGIPNTASIGLVEVREEVATASTGDPLYGRGEMMTADALGRQLFALETPGYYGGGYEPPNFQSFRHANRRKITLLLKLDPEVSSSGDLSEVRFSGPKVNSIEQLPADFKARVLAAKAKAMEEFKKRPPPPEDAPNSRQGSAARL